MRPSFPAGGTFHESLRSKSIISHRTLLLAVSLLLAMLILTKVSDILSGNASGDLILSGELTGPTSDSDEWVFSDGTGEVVLDFASNDVPAVGDPIYVHGTVSSGPEIDVIAWEPINS